MTKAGGEPTGLLTSWWLWGVRPVRVPSTPTKMFLFFEVSWFFGRLSASPSQWPLSVLAALHGRLRPHLGWQETSWSGTFALDTEGSLADLICGRCRQLNHIHLTGRGNSQFCPYITTGPGCHRPCIYPPLRHLSPFVLCGPSALAADHSSSSG